MTSDYEFARLKYKPDRIKFLLIAEAPPKADTGRFFYFENVAKGDSLFLETMKVLYPAEYSDTKTVRSRKKEFLARFKNDGFYLIDASEEPMQSACSTRKEAQLERCLPYLAKKVRYLVSEDTRVILIAVPVYRVCRDRLEREGFRVINTCPIEFPASGHQVKFRQKLSALLREHGWAQPYNTL